MLLSTTAHTALATASSNLRLITCKGKAALFTNYCRSSSTLGSEIVYWLGVLSSMSEYNIAKLTISYLSVDIL